MSEFSDFLIGHFTIWQYAEFLIRLVISCLCGACIGFERTKRLKEAGVRTHIIVCCAAAMMMLVSKYGFTDLTSGTGNLFSGDRGADPSRIAAQIISGVSFLGAGIIFRNGNSVRGLTTAAGIWATAGIGLAIGAGMYVIGVAGTLIIAVIQIIMHKFTVGADSMIIGTIVCKVTDAEKFHVALDNYLKRNKMQVIATKVNYDESNGQTYQFTMRMNADLTVDDLTAFLESLDCVHPISCEIGK